jgi:hypothetical protein
MQLETLLVDIRRDFTLTRETIDDSSAQRIVATPKPNRAAPGLRGAMLEIDPETKAIRQLVLNRLRNGQPLATVTYTLVETGTQDDAKYELEGHLPSKATILSRSNMAHLRAGVLSKFFGDGLAFGPREAKKP